MRGFTLIEALLALVVCACGVLGIASLLTQGLALHSSALSHETANALLADMNEALVVNAADPNLLPQWQARVATELPAMDQGPAQGSVTTIGMPDGTPAQRISLRWGQTDQRQAAEASVLHVVSQWPAP